MKTTNSQLIGIMNILGTLTSKKMPFKILYAIHRSVPEIEAAYKAYDETLEDICRQYGVTKQDLAACEKNKQAELNEAITDLLSTETEVEVHTFDESVLESYDDTRFDPLTYAEIDTLYRFVEEA